MDNIAGLNMGQKVIAEDLPNHLAEVYGANPVAVRAKIAKLRFDWKTYNPRTCSVKYSSEEVGRTGGNADDMGLRFNKFQMYPDYEGPNFTLKAPDFPLSNETAPILSYESNACSVVTDYDFKMKGHDIKHYIEAVGGEPPRPSSNPDSPYWPLFREVTQRQIERREGKLPPSSDYVAPKLWENFSVAEIAEAVHNEVSACYLKDAYAA